MLPFYVGFSQLLILAGTFTPMHEVVFDCGVHPSMRFTPVDFVKLSSAGPTALSPAQPWALSHTFAPEPTSWTRLFACQTSQ